MLGHIIETLEAENPHKVLPHGFTNPHSYRGDYYELAFEPADNVTVADCLEAARSALGTTYEGWKGGQFTMSEYSTCHLAFEGENGEELGPRHLALMLAAGHIPDVPATPGDTHTIPLDVAQELWENRDRTASYGGYTIVHDEQVDSGRWSTFHRIIIRRDTDQTLWALSYEMPATEEQDCDLFADDPVTVSRVRAEQVTVTRYVPA